MPSSSAYASNDARVTRRGDYRCVSEQTKRVELVVVRAWTEGHGPSAFRARVTVVPDIGMPEEHVAVLGSPQEVVDLVRACLAGFEDPPPGHPAPLGD
jgi:hypothetical protein